jgi:hypothetical protein
MRPTAAALSLCASALSLLAICAPAGADVFGPISLVSDNAIEQANYAHDPAISADGRYVAFDGYFDGQTGVWRRDLQTGTVEPVAVGEPETPAGSAELPSISEDGRYVSFTTLAALSPANDKNIGPDVYVRDMDVAEAQPCEETTLHPSESCPFTLASAMSGSTHGLTYTYSHGVNRENEEEEYGAQAAGRSALSADGQEVVFVTTAPSDLAGLGTPQLEVAVRYLQSGKTELVSVEYDKTSGRSVPGSPVALEKEGESYGAVYSAGKAPAFKPPEPYTPTAEVPASISADGSTVTWLAQDVGEQAPTLANETLDAVYGEPLWRRIADGEEAPTRRVTGGSDPTNPACVASGEKSLPEQPSLSDPCQGPFSTTVAYGIWEGGEGDAVPRLSADGYTVAFVANAPLASLGNDFGVDRTTRHSDLYVADMHAGLSRVQALTPLTELASGEEADISTNGQIMDLGISADASQVAFTTMRTVFPLGSPAYVSAPAAVPGLLELFDVDLTDDTLTRVTHGYEDEASEHPHETVDKEDQYEDKGDGTLSPSFSASGETVAFSSTASNLVFGDGNTPPPGSESFDDGSDVFTVDRILFHPDPTPQAISSQPPSPTIAPLWSLGVTSLSLSNGSVRLYAELPGAGTLRALASGAVTERVKVRTSRGSRHRGKTTRVRTSTVVVTRNLVTSTQAEKSSSGGLATLVLTLPASYRALAARTGGLSATVSITFTAAGHPVLRQSLTVSFRSKTKTNTSHRSSAKASARSRRRADRRR